MQNNLFKWKIYHCDWRAAKHLHDLCVCVNLIFFCLWHHAVFVAGGSIWSISWGGIRSWSATSSSKAASSTTTTKPWIYNQGATDQSEEVLSQKKHGVHTLVNSAFIKHVSTQHLFINEYTEWFIFHRHDSKGTACCFLSEVVFLSRFT